MNQLPTIKEVELKKTYFRNNPRFGRTTTLVSKSTGETLGTWIGSLSKTVAYQQLQQG